MASNAWSERTTLNIDYGTPPAALTGLLEWLEEHIDLAHAAAVEERHVKALEWQPLDRPPVSYCAPVAEPFAVYPYAEAFRDPVRMLINELVGPYAAMGTTPSIINSVLVRDDYPLQIRAFYGVGLFVSLFGVESEPVGDSFPWVRPVGLQELHRIVTHGVPELRGGLFQRALDTMAFYREALAPYPRCCQAIHITQPDLQGPFEDAAHLWGSEIFTAFYDCPGFLRDLLDVLAETYVAACRRVAAESTQTARAGYIYLHFGLFKGGALLKDDSCVMLSPELYRAFVQPVNSKVLQALGGGGIHWCGRGDQWRPDVLDTPGLTCLDWGNPAMLDLPAWAAALKERRIPVGRMEWTASDFVKMQPVRLFPTGASLALVLDDIGRAGEIMRLVMRP